jgi:dehydrogenase/reductase SDR family protein 12
MPEKFLTNDFGVEQQMASQLFGHYYLLKILNESGKLSDGARVIWMSSGGMYLSSLSLDNLFENHKYDKVQTYANVKRAQVSLLENMREEFKTLKVIGTHPGWVDTPGVQDAIEGFHKKMDGRLRSPLQGADSILWPLTTIDLESGEFYFDHKKVAKKFFFFTKVDQGDVQKLNSILDDNYLKFS